MLSGCSMLGQSFKMAYNVSGLAEVPHATLFKYMHNFSCGILAS
jgi:hypothetical protein